jgi:type I restriction enzyme S subunit
MTLHPPGGWRLHRLGQLFDERKQKVSDKDFPPLSVTMNGIVPQLETAAKTDDGDNRKLVKAGDYVINSRSDRKGSGGVSDYDGSVSLISIVLKPKNIHPPFAHHLLRSQAFQEEFYRWGHGIVADLWTTRYSDMKNIRLYVPDTRTQAAIADFLDRETARIDQLMEKKKRLVELIAERELNYMIHIFGELSQESRSWKIAHVCVLQRGRFNHRPRNSPELYDGEHPFLQTGDVAQAKKYIRAHKQTLTDLGAAVSAKFPRGTVLMAIAANVGDVAISDFDAYCPDSVVGFVPSKQLDKEFLYYALRSLRPSIATSSTSNAQDNTNIARLGALRVPMPDMGTQRRIVERLDHAELRNYALVDATSKSIEHLREFRSALITAAVTGQIDVTTWGKLGQTDRRLDRIEEAMRA